jgi:hypothetical protein
MKKQKMSCRASLRKNATSKKFDMDEKEGICTAIF